MEGLVLVSLQLAATSGARLAPTGSDLVLPGPPDYPRLLLWSKLLSVAFAGLICVPTGAIVTAEGVGRRRPQQPIVEMLPTPLSPVSAATLSLLF